MPYIYKSGLQFGINETNIYGGASYVELTQAEYDALSDSEKHNGQIYFITDGNYDFLIVNDSVPVGSIQAYGGMTAPTNWLICDGSAVSRTDYKELFEVIGVSYGEGDGITTFNLPDLRGRVTIGYGLGTAQDAVERTLGQIGGSERVALTVNQLPSHIHKFNRQQWYSSDTQTSTSTGTIYSWKTTTGGSTSYSYQGGDSQYGPTGSGEAHGNMQPYLATNYIIKAKNPSITSGQQLQAMELFYPVGSYFETSDSTFNPNVEWGGEWSCQIPQEVLINTGSVTVNANQNYNLCTITLEPNTEYMIYTNVKTNNGNSLTLLNVIDINGTVKNQHGAEARVTTSSGQGVVNWRYVYTDNNTVTATLRCYGYYTTSHTEEGRIIAVPINRTLNYKWHRTA